MIILSLRLKDAGTRFTWTDKCPHVPRRVKSSFQGPRHHAGHLPRPSLLSNDSLSTSSHRRQMFIFARLHQIVIFCQAPTAVLNVLGMRPV